MWGSWGWADEGEVCELYKAVTVSHLIMVPAKLILRDRRGAIVGPADESQIYQQVYSLNGVTQKFISKLI